MNFREAGRLESQLDDAMRRFVNDPLRNRVGTDKAELSTIFNWFGGDFKKDAGRWRISSTAMLRFK